MQIKATYIDHMGSDLDVVNAARVSFDKGSDWEPYEVPCSCAVPCEAPCTEWKYRLSEADTKLIHYLAKHHHWTPFAHTSIKLRVTAPIPIRTQCFKHKFGFVENEESRRYISSKPEVFIPEFREKADKVKQGSGGKHPNADYWDRIYRLSCEYDVHTYLRMIDDGVCPEQARFVLPQGVMVTWIWTGSLAAYARFYRQRTDPHAQKETADLALQISEIIRPLFPVSWEALTNG